MNEIQFILYQLPDENGKVQVVIKDETIWATQKAMAQLFGVGVPAISKHLKGGREGGKKRNNFLLSRCHYCCWLPGFLPKGYTFSPMGYISAQQAKEKAEAEYDIFNRTQHIDSDFDKEIRGMIEGKEK